MSDDQPKQESPYRAMYDRCVGAWRRVEPHDRDTTLELGRVECPVCGAGFTVSVADGQATAGVPAHQAGPPF